MESVEKKADEEEKKVEEEEEEEGEKISELEKRTSISVNLAIAVHAHNPYTTQCIKK